LFGPACDRSWFETIARELHHQAQHQKNEAKPLIAEIASDFAKQSLYGLLNAVHVRFHSGNRTPRLPSTVDKKACTSDLNQHADLI